MTVYYVVSLRTSSVLKRVSLRSRRRHQILIYPRRAVYNGRGVRECENVIRKRAIPDSDCKRRQNHINNDKETMSSKCRYQHNQGPFHVVCASTRNGAMDRDE